jgi:large subunit ribosomal protein L13e
MSSHCAGLKGDDLKVENITRQTQSVLPIPSGTIPEEPRAITEEEQEFQAYATLRKARSDARYIGVRKIRAEKKAEEAAAAKK